jgi:acetolactate synthase-1/2/3 large subunit
MTGSQLIARILKKEGIGQVFCFPYTPIIESLAEEEIRIIVARQERVAENMADGFSRTTFGKNIGVVTVQQAAGAENAFAGIAQAYTDSSPILFLPGHPGRSRTGVPSVFDAVRNYSATTKWADTIPSANDVSNRMRRAFTALRSGRPGPVLLEVPVDVAKEECTDQMDYQPVSRVRTAPDLDLIREAVRMLLTAEKPTIWAGQGVLYAEASDELCELAELLAAPVLSTLLGKSNFNERHPLALGAAGLSQTTLVGDYLNQCDAIFAVGASLTSTVFAPELPVGAKLIHATVDPKDLNKDAVPELGILGDAKLVLAAMIEEVRSQSGGKGRAGRSQVEQYLADKRVAWKAYWAPKLNSGETPINPYRVIGDFMKSTDPANTIVTHDSGNPRDQLLPIYESITPRGYLGWGHSTQLGFSLGAIMGAKIAAPEKLAVNFMGDAAFGMVGMDIETAVREEIPILTMLLNNSAMGGYQKYIPKAVERYGTKYLTGNYSEVAHGLGAYTERIEQPSEIIPAIERAITQIKGGKPALLEFITCEEPDMAIPSRA